jgi:signal transduction histidine kinase
VPAGLYGENVQGRFALIEVVDRGCGIAADQLAVIFNLSVQEARNAIPRTAASASA